MRNIMGVTVLPYIDQTQTASFCQYTDTEKYG